MRNLRRKLCIPKSLENSIQMKHLILFPVEIFKKRTAFSINSKIRQLWTINNKEKAKVLRKKCLHPYLEDYLQKNNLIKFYWTPYQMYFPIKVFSLKGKVHTTKPINMRKPPQRIKSLPYYTMLYCGKKAQYKVVQVILIPKLGL